MRVTLPGWILTVLWILINMTTSSYNGPRPMTEGRAAYRSNLPAISNPYWAGTHSALRWLEGWKNAEAAFAEEQAEEDARNAQCKACNKNLRVHNEMFFKVAEWLAESEIDPYDLRDYLAGLPERE